MNISKLSEMELKSMWYDELTKKEQAEVNMRLINEQILKLRQNEVSTEDKIEEDTKNKE